MNGVILFGTIWISFGIIGYFVMRHLFILKKRGWNKKDQQLGLISILFGPLFLALALQFHNHKL